MKFAHDLCFCRWALLGFLLACTAPGFAAGQCMGMWDDLGPVPSPVSDLYALAYDSRRDRSVLFGGFSGVGVPRGETLEWDGMAWAVRPVAGPSPRGGCAAIYEPQLHRIILFGGTNGEHYFDETWAFDGVGWTELKIPGPPARAQHSFTRDEWRGEGVLFGGHDGSGYLDDCWRWTGSEWARVSGPVPAARAGHAAAFDQGRGVVVMFGGRAGSTTFFSDTWEWSGESWTERQVTGPEPRAQAAMTYDDGLGRVLMLGGFAYFGVPHDYFECWEWDGLSWSLLDEPYVAGNIGHAAVYEASRHRTLVGPGRRGGFPSSQTFAYTASTPPLIESGPDAQSVCPGGAAAFSVSAHGPGPVSYRWHLSDTPLEDGPTTTGSIVTGSASPMLMIVGAGPSDEGLYSCRLENACGTVSSATAALRLCRADLTCDGMIDFADYLEFLNLYDSADPRADFNDDGLIDFADYLEFLNRYDAGC